METRSRFTAGALAVAIAAILSGCFQAPEPATPTAAPNQTVRSAQADAISAAQQGRPPDPSPAPEPVTEIDLGAPLYPGAQFMQPQSSRNRNLDEESVTGVFTVADPPAMVVAYYRDYLLTRARGAELLETPTPMGGVMLMLDEPGTDTAVQIEINPSGSGSSVKIISVVFPIG